MRLRHRHQDRCAEARWKRAPLDRGPPAAKRLPRGQSFALFALDMKSAGIRPKFQRGDRSSRWRCCAIATASSALRIGVGAGTGAARPQLDVDFMQPRPQCRRKVCGSR
jgi:hypothetical protein